MTPPPQTETGAQIPSVPRHAGESASHHVVRLVEDALTIDGDDQSARVLTVGFRQDEDRFGSLDLVVETIGELRQHGIEVTGYDAETTAETIGDTPDTPTDCYDAIVLFAPLNAVEDLAVDDLFSDAGGDQLVIDLTGTVEPGVVASHDAVCVTYRVL